MRTVGAFEAKNTIGTLLAWACQDECTNAVHLVQERIVERGARVPMLWRLEVANALEMGVRRGRTTATYRDQTMADLEIRTDGETVAQAWKATLALAVRHLITLSPQPVWNWRRAGDCLWPRSTKI